jgi:ASPM-SPD-2-Hydin domain-containing protein
MMRKLTLVIVVLLAATSGPTALGAVGVAVNPGDLSFGRVATGDSPTQQEKITNGSGADAVIALDTGSNGAFSIVNDNCTGPLPDGQNCTFGVQYNPSSAGGDSSTLTVDEGAAGTDTFALSGTGVANRFIFTNPPGNPDFGNVAIGDTSGSKQITITNNTDYPDNPNVHLGGSDPGQFSESDDCGSNVANSCTAMVSFQPTSQGGKSANLQIDSDSFQFTGTGIGQFDVSPLSLSFGTQRVNTASTAQPITFTNHRNNAVNVIVSNGNSADYNVDDSNCVGGVPAGQSCLVNVVFQPNTAGSQPGTVTVQGQDVSLSGTGTLPGASVSPGSIGFGNQPVSTSSAIRTITVTNNGSENLVFSQATLTGANPAQFTLSDTCFAASPLQPGDQCTMSVQFFPTSVGSASAVVQVNDNAPGSPQTVNVSGTGTPSAVVFKPSPVQFKRPHHAGTFSTPRTLTLTNKTNGPITVSKVGLAGQNPNSFRITGGNCPGATLPADGSCNETVRFAPNEVGVKGASLMVNDSGANSPHALALTGISTYPRDDVAVHGAAGCDATKITFRRGGSSSRFDRTVIVRSRTHIPTGPNDGTRRPHGAGVLHDRELDHFAAYEYRVFALYRSHTRPGTLNHSRGIILRLRTGEICTPMDGGVISDTTPTISWLKHSTLFGYSFLLFHAGDQVQQKRSVHATSFTLSGRRRLHHGLTYTLFLYAYPPAHPEGTPIGRTTFRVR